MSAGQTAKLSNNKESSSRRRGDWDANIYCKVSFPFLRLPQAGGSVSVMRFHPPLRGERQRAPPLGTPPLRGERQRAPPSGLPPLRGERQRDSSLWNPVFACGRDGSFYACRRIP